MVDNIGGRSLKKPAQGAARWPRDLYIIQSVDHIFHPCIPLLLPDFEAQMRFAQTQPPPALRILAGASQELRQERGELFDCALEGFSRKERAE